MSIGPSFLERLLYITVRMSGTNTDGDLVSGTAFFYNHRFAGGDHLFLVSNCHVVDELNEGTLTFHTRVGNEPDPTGKLNIKVRDLHKGWIKHPDDLDLAMMPVSFLYDFLRRSLNRPYVQALTRDLVPTIEERREKIDALEDVYFIGYPNDLHDRVNNLPIVRKGTTATPYSVDFNGQASFLLDGGIFPGSSGSPVLMIDQNGYIDKNDVFVPERRVFFLGILKSCFTYSERLGMDGPQDSTGTTRTFYKQMMDLGVVLRSDVLVDMVEDHLVKDSETKIKSRLSKGLRNLFRIY